MQLKNQRILLTGAAGGIGKHIALLLAQKGAHLALAGRDGGKLQELANEINNRGGSAKIIITDFERAEAAAQVASEARHKLGGIDILINNAGVMDFIRFEDQRPERIAQIIQTNVTATIQLAHAVLPTFKAAGYGHYVMIGSILGSIGFPYYATYSASKFAIHGFSQALRRELIDTDIGVTYIAPRGVNTALNDANTLEMLAKTGNKLDDPEKVAAIVVKALEQEKQEVFIGQPESFFAWLNGVAPKIVNIGLRKQARLAKQFAIRKVK